MPSAQHADVLGPDFTAQYLPLRPDDEGPVIATLVRRQPQQQSKRAVLYVHGFVDYFFHPHVAQAFVDQGFDFYAVDLRKYGRSWRAGQTMNYSTDFAEYDEELNEAIRIIRAEGHDTVLVYGHSTGGLIVPLWAQRHRGQGLVDGLILNSPFFDLNGSTFERGPLTAVLDTVAPLAPKVVISALPSPYAQALHVSNGGEWDFDTTWKTIEAFPVRAGWVRAARRAHKELNAGLDIDVPILVLTSARSGNARNPGAALKDSDCVLNVEHMTAGAEHIGGDVTVVPIAGGFHDLALSPAPVRQRFLDEITSWTARKFPVSAGDAG